MQLLFAAGLRPPYSRATDAVLGFLRDVCEPFLRLFRRLLPAFGGFDFSPILAIITLQIINSIVVEASSTAERRDGALRTAAGRRAGCAGARSRPASWSSASTSSPSTRSRTSIAPGEERSVLPGVQLVNTRNHGVAFGFLPGSQTLVTILIGAGAARVCSSTSRGTCTRPLIWLPTGMLLGGALGNILDRVRDGSVTDFVKLPLGWPPFNLADAVDHARHPRSCSS